MLCSPKSRSSWAADTAPAAPCDPPDASSVDRLKSCETDERRRWCRRNPAAPPLVGSVTMAAGESLLLVLVGVEPEPDAVFESEPDVLT